MKLAIEVDPSIFTAPFLEVVYTCGLDIVDKKQAQILVKSGSLITDDDLNSGKKIIVIEKTSGGNIAHRELLRHPSVIRYVKSFNYSNYQLHNQPCIDGRLFTRTLGTYDDFKLPEYFLTKEDYNKITLGWSILNYPGLKSILSLDRDELIDLDSHRPIDVFFAGNLYYDNEGGNRRSGDLITAHRLRCVEALEAIKHHNVFIVKGNALDLDFYNQLICHSKVIVSPWGWGEPCFRDFEAIAAGCILIKPLTNFIRSTCGIFEHSYCMWTRPDFSDLSQIIDRALKMFNEVKFQRIKNRDKIIECAETLPLTIKRNLTVIM